MIDRKYHLDPFLGVGGGRRMSIPNRVKHLDSFRADFDSRMTGLHIPWINFRRGLKFLFRSLFHNQD